MNLRLNLWFTITTRVYPLSSRLVLSILWLWILHDTYPSLYYHTEYFCPQKPLYSACLSPSPLPSLGNHWCFYVFIVLTFPECHIVGIMQYGVFSDWLLLLSTQYAFKGSSQGALVVKNLSVNARDIRDAGSIPGSGTSPAGGHGNLLQCSFLENPMDTRAWCATVHGVAQSRTQLKQLSTHIHLWMLHVFMAW